MDINYMGRLVLLAFFYVGWTIYGDMFPSSQYSLIVIDTPVTKTMVTQGTFPTRKACEAGAQELIDTLKGRREVVVYCTRSR